MKLALVFLFSLLVLPPSSPAKLKKSVSSFFQVCHRNDPKLSECIRNTLEASRESLINGIPELDVVPMDPLFIPELDFGSGLGLKFVLKNATITGLKNFELRSVTADFNRKAPELYINMFTPKIQFKGKYTMKGQVIILPVDGEGDVTFSFDKVLTKSVSKLETYEKNGKTYVRVKTMDWIIEPQGAKSQFTNLFNGDRTLGEATNRFLNDNWKEAFEAYKILPQQAFGEVFKQLTNRVYEHFTFDEWFPQ